MFLELLLVLSLGVELAVPRALAAGPPSAVCINFLFAKEVL
jgi:hypothetical protein